MKFYLLRLLKWNALILSLVILLPFAASAAAQQGEVNLDKYQGKVVYLDFWASWCGPCKLSFPFMEGLTHDYSRDDLVVVTVNLDRTQSLAKAFLRKMGSNLSVIYDEKGAIAQKYKVSDMPTSILIDRQGNIRFTHKGFHLNKKDEYIASINKLIHEN